VFLSSVPFRRDAALDSLEAAAYLPDHRGAMGVGVSDAWGHAEIAGVTPGTYCAWASHPDYAPVDPAWQGVAELEVPGGQALLVCRMAPLVAIWVALPRDGVARARFRGSDSRVKSPLALDLFLWSVAKSVRESPNHVVDPKMLSMARVGILLDEVDGGPLGASVACRGYDGRWWEYETQYRTMEDLRLRGPQIIDANMPPCPHTKLRVDLLDDGGIALENVPLRLIPVRENEGLLGGREETVECLSGVPLTVGVGEWKIEPGPQLLSTLSGQARIWTHEESEAVVLLRTIDALQEVRFCASDADWLDPSLGIDLLVDGVRVGGQAVSGGMTSPMWLPRGNYEVRYVLGVGTARNRMLEVAAVGSALTIRLEGE
jgi:hypothetical protein